MQSQQLTTLHIEFSDEPKVEVLRFEHVKGPVLLHGLVLALATFAWLMELCIAAVKNRKKRLAEIRQWDMRHAASLPL